MDELVAKDLYLWKGANIMNPKVSVIIPVYKTEEYLAENSSCILGVYVIYWDVHEFWIFMDYCPPFWLSPYGQAGRLPRVAKGHIR